MVERTRSLDIACHGLLILGGLLVCLPIYFAFVVGSHTVGDVLAVPPPWLPGTRFFENAQTAWQKGNLGRLLFNSLVVALGIMIGKIAVSLLSAFAISNEGVRAYATSDGTVALRDRDGRTLPGGAKLAEPAES